MSHVSPQSPFGSAAANISGLSLCVLSMSQVAFSFEVGNRVRFERSQHIIFPLSTPTPCPPTVAADSSIRCEHRRRTRRDVIAHSHQQSRDLARPIRRTPRSIAKPVVTAPLATRRRIGIRWTRHSSAAPRLRLGRLRDDRPRSAEPRVPRTMTAIRTPANRQIRSSR